MEASARGVVTAAAAPAGQVHYRLASGCGQYRNLEANLFLPAASLHRPLLAKPNLFKGPGPNFRAEKQHSYNQPTCQPDNKQPLSSLKNMPFGAQYWSLCGQIRGSTNYIDLS